MKHKIKISGIYLLMLLYCSTFTPIRASEYRQISSSDIINIIDEILSSKSLAIQASSEQFDFQLKSITKKNDFQKKNLTKLIFTLRSDISFRTGTFQVKGSKETLPLCFSQTDLVFPFHNFW